MKRSGLDEIITGILKEGFQIWIQNAGAGVSVRLSAVNSVSYSATTAGPVDDLVKLIVEARMLLKQHLTRR